MLWWWSVSVTALVIPIVWTVSSVDTDKNIAGTNSYDKISLSMFQWGKICEYRRSTNSRSN